MAGMSLCLHLFVMCQNLNHDALIIIQYASANLLIAIVRSAPLYLTPIILF